MHNVGTMQRAITSILRDFARPCHLQGKECDYWPSRTSLEGFLSLTLCNKANFDPILLVKYDVLQNGLKMNSFYRMFSFP